MSKTDSAGKVVWYVRLQHEGRERRFGSFPTKTKAREFYQKAKTEQHEGRFFPERYQHGGYELVQEAIDRYLTSMGKAKSIRDHRYFAEWWGKQFERKRLNAITVTGLEAIRQGMLTTGRANGRINRYFAWLRACLNVAVRHGQTTSNPASKLKMLPEPSGKTRLLTPDEEAKLLQAIGPTYAPWVRFAILTGLRREEQFTLEWMNVDLELGIITLPETKVGGVQYAPLNEEAKAILRNLDSWHRSKWVFPSSNSATHLDPDNFMYRYREAVKRAGIAWVTWHDLRHCFASRLAMSNAPLGTIAALLRHSTTALVRRYAHLSPSHLRDAVEMVSAFGRARKPDHEEQLHNGTVTGTVTEGEEKVRQDV